MTLKERVIVETYTGYCMTAHTERDEVYKYMAEIMGRPVFTHELASKEIQDQLKEKAKADFIALCSSSLEQPAAVLRVKDIISLLRLNKKIEIRENNFYLCDTEKDSPALALFNDREVSNWFPYCKTQGESTIVIDLKAEEGE